jgi:hypothetical protein
MTALSTWLRTQLKERGPTQQAAAIHAGEENSTHWRCEMPHEPLLEEIVEEGTCVFSSGWDTGSPVTGTGYERIYRLGNLYAAYSSFGEATGPFSTLTEAIRHSEYGKVFPGSVEFWSSEMTSEELAALLECVEPPDTLQINGEEWVLGEGGKFVRQP